MPFLDYLTKDELETKLGVLGRENSIRLGGDMENRSLLGTILPVDIIRIFRCMADLVNHVQFVIMLSKSPRLGVGMRFSARTVKHNMTTCKVNELNHLPSLLKLVTKLNQGIQCRLDLLTLQIHVQFHDAQ